jgi:hypothetical protein
MYTGACAMGKKQHERERKNNNGLYYLLHKSILKIFPWGMGIPHRKMLNSYSAVYALSEV